MFETNVVIIGAGASGLMCAREASARGRRVIVMEHGSRAGRKILLAGGGKCNFTNRQCRAGNYVSGNTDFCRSALKRYGSEDVLAMMQRYGLRWEERELGRLFFRDSAWGFLEKLLGECRKQGVEIMVNCQVKSIRKEDRFIISTSLGEYRCESVVAATGGLSYPQAGASDFGHRLAKRFGLAVIACRPGLAGLRYNHEDRRRFGGLAGVSVPARVCCGEAAFTEDVLFTHEGLSGPGILQASLYWKAGQEVLIDWLPGCDAAAMLDVQKREYGSRRVATVLSQLLPSRLVEQWRQQWIPDKRLAECTREELKRTAEGLQRWIFQPCGTEGYNKAEVTVGGVDTRGLSSKTMESLEVKGLYFIGETMDVTGQLGGYNLQWAWSSGWAAGQAV